MLLCGTFPIHFQLMDRAGGEKNIFLSKMDINPAAVTRKTVKNVSPQPQGAQIFLLPANGMEALSIAHDRASPAEGDGCVMGQFLTW